MDWRSIATLKLVIWVGLSVGIRRAVENDSRANRFNPYNPKNDSFVKLDFLSLTQTLRLLGILSGIFQLASRPSGDDGSSGEMLGPFVLKTGVARSLQRHAELSTFFARMRIYAPIVCGVS